MVLFEAAPAAGRRDAGRARGRLLRHPAPRGDRPRHGGRLQPQEHLDLRRQDRQADRQAVRHHRRRRHAGPTPRGAINVDDEGNAGRHDACSSQDGILTTYLHDTISAQALRRRSPPATAGARATATRRMPRMRSTYMLPGPHTTEEIIASVKKGIYCTQLHQRPGEDRRRRLHLLREERLPDRGRQAHPARSRTSTSSATGPKVARARRHGRRRPRHRRGRLDLRQGRPARAGLPGPARPCASPRSPWAAARARARRRDHEHQPDGRPRDRPRRDEERPREGREGGGGHASTARRNVERRVARRQGREDQRGHDPRARRSSSTSTAATRQVSSSRPAARGARRRFIADSVAMTRALAADPFRSLPDPALYAGPGRGRPAARRPGLRDASTPERRRDGRAADGGGGPRREGRGGDPLGHHRLRRHAHGELPRGLERLRGHAASTPSFFVSAAGQRQGRRRPAARGLRLRRRALPRRGARRRPRSAARPPSGRSPASARRRPPSAVHDRWSSTTARRAGSWARSRGPLSGAALQQKRSFLEGKLGQAIGSPLLDVARRPAHPEGASARGSTTARGSPRSGVPVFEKGVLRSYYIDTYYGKKLKMAPTTGRASQPGLDARREAAGRAPRGRRRGHPGHRLPRRQLERHDRRLLVRRAGLPHPRRPARRAGRAR